MRLLSPISGVPPHIHYMCASCEQVFSTAERTAYHDPRGDIGSSYYCAVCAAVENRRRAS